MEFLQLIVLSLIQGITEFLPVSSSAHLILVPVLTGWEDQGLIFDVAAHLGTLFAVILYYRSELCKIALDLFGDIRSKQIGESSQLLWFICVASLPLGFCGLLFKDSIEAHLRSPLVIAATTVIFGLLLAVADRSRSSTGKINFKTALVIGLAQALALIPGTSRSGVTISAALLLGFSRQSAAKFSFLLSIPAILMPCFYYGFKIFQNPEVELDILSIVIVIFFSFISAYSCIALFIKALDKIGMMPFVIYRVFLGALLLVVFL